ncbi:hypothetical protein GCM10010528_29260 [Gordonia defluvii]|jgi:hypothetical protein|uniref:Uncharacterized protein n=1 Tax=Gordonia defluvii TaxID=283718 RepID=A0ABP6LP78_9ACTN|nr:hypothetical protein [Gordonia sp. UBA5067]
MKTIQLASSWDPAALTIGVTVYAAAILICLLVGVNAASRGRRRLAIAMAVAVGALTVLGVVLAVMSSIH